MNGAAVVYCISFRGRDQTCKDKHAGRGDRRGEVSAVQLLPWESILQFCFSSKDDVDGVKGQQGHHYRNWVLSQ